MLKIKKCLSIIISLCLMLSIGLPVTYATTTEVYEQMLYDNFDYNFAETNTSSAITSITQLPEGVSGYTSSVSAGSVKIEKGGEALDGGIATVTNKTEGSSGVNMAVKLKDSTKAAIAGTDKISIEMRLKVSHPSVYYSRMNIGTESLAIGETLLRLNTAETAWDNLDPENKAPISANTWFKLTLKIDQNTQKCQYLINDVSLGEFDTRDTQFGFDSTKDKFELSVPWNTTASFQITARNKATAAVSLDYIKISGVGAAAYALADINQISMDDLTNEAPEFITQDLTLPTVGSKYQSTLSWSSDRPDVIANDGTVIRPLSDTAVTLTVTATQGSGSAQASYRVFVSGTASVTPPPINAYELLVADTFNYEFAASNLKNEFITQTLPDGVSEYAASIYSGSLGAAFSADATEGGILTLMRGNGDADVQIRLTEEMRNTIMSKDAIYIETRVKVNGLGDHLRISLGSETLAFNQYLRRLKNDGSGFETLSDLPRAKIKVNEWTEIGVKIDLTTQKCEYFVNDASIGIFDVRKDSTSGAYEQAQTGFSLAAPWTWRTPTSFHMQARSNEGALLQADYFKFYDASPRILAQADMNRIKYADLTEEHPSAITSNLKTPFPTLDAKYNAPITWTSSQPGVLANDGTVIRPAEDTDVVLTATAQVGADPISKKFYFNVKGTQAATPETLYKVFNEDFSSGTVSENWSVQKSTTGKVEVTDGKLVISDTKAESSAKLRFFTLDEMFTLAGKVTISAEVAAENAREFILSMADSQENILLQQVFGKSDLYFKTNEGDSIKITYDSGVAVKIKQVIDTENDKVELWVNEYLISAQPLSTLENGVDVASWKFSLTKAEKYPAKLTVDNIQVEILAESIAAVAAQGLGFEQIKLANTDQDYITGNLNLMEDFQLGTKIAWTSDKPNIISHAGVVNRPVSGTEVVTLTAKVYLANAPESFVNKPIIVTVIPFDNENYALEKNVTVNTVTAVGSDIKNINDGLAGTMFISQEAGRSFAVTIDMGQTQTVNKFKLIQDSGNAFVTGYTIELSKDGNSWTEVYQKTGIATTEETKTAVTDARYVRFKLDKQDGKSANISEIEIRLEVTDIERVALAAKLFNPSIPNSTSTNITLPTQAEYGCTITWSSSNTDVITAAGVVTPAASTTTVMLTAQITSNSASTSKLFAVTVPGTSPGGGGAGGGGGGATGGTGGGAPGGVTFTPHVDPSAGVVTPQDTFQEFNDMAAASWAEPYVNDLYKKGIVNGNGKGGFEPLRNITREEFVKVVVLAFDVQTSGSDTLSFADVNLEDWYYSYLQKAVKAGIINGLSEQEFGVGKSITREDMFTMAVRALKYSNRNLPEKGGVALNDTDQISDYAKEAIEALNRAGIVSGDDAKRVNPKNNATRAEMAKIVSMILSL